MDRVSEVETPLLARIEALAARAADDVQAERAAADEVAAVRSDLSSLRADVARLAETLTGGLQAQASRFEGEVRGPLESRLAALEDTLDGVAERLESFSLEVLRDIVGVRLRGRDVHSAPRPALPEARPAASCPDRSRRDASCTERSAKS